MPGIAAWILAAVLNINLEMKKLIAIYKERNRQIEKKVIITRLRIRRKEKSLQIASQMRIREKIERLHSVAVYIRLFKRRGRRPGNFHIFFCYRFIQETRFLLGGCDVYDRCLGEAQSRLSVVKVAM